MSSLLKFNQRKKDAHTDCFADWPGSCLLEHALKFSESSKVREIWQLVCRMLQVAEAPQDADQVGKVKRNMHSCSQTLKHPRKFCSFDLAMALHGFGIDNIAAQNAIEGSKALHARRWQTKDGTYRLKRHALPDVRDTPLDYDNAAASSTDANPR